MRAAIAASTVVVIGLFLFAAAAFTLPPIWIGLGLLAVALVGSFVVVLTEPAEAGAVA